MLYEFLVGKPPFEDNSEKGTYKKIKTGTPVFPLNLTKEAKDLITKLLTVDAPTVVLHAPAVDAQGLADALTALTDEATEEEALVTLRALRRASHDEAAREALLAPRVVARAVEYAALSAAAPRAWSDSGTSAEATVPPHNRTDPSPGLAPSLTVSLRLIPTLIRCCCTTCWSSTGRAWAVRCARRPSTRCRSSSPP